MDLRCGPKLHGVLVEGTPLVEIKCSSVHCGHGRGTVVFHRFSVVTGRLEETLRFKEPNARKE